MKAYIKYITIALFIIAIGSCITENENTEIVNYINPGDKIPYFTVPDQNGNLFNSTSLTGKKSLLLFFHTECEDCRRELPIIEESYQNFKEDTNYCFIAIAREEPVESVNKYWKENNLTLPTYFDYDRNVYSLFANSMIPRIYILNENGIVTYMGIENLGLTAQELNEKITNQ